MCSRSLVGRVDECSSNCGFLRMLINVFIWLFTQLFNVIFFVSPFFKRSPPTLIVRRVRHRKHQLMEQIHLCQGSRSWLTWPGLWRHPAAPGRTPPWAKLHVHFITIILVGNSVASWKFQILRKKAEKWLCVICKSWLKIKYKLGYLQSTFLFFPSFQQKKIVWIQKWKQTIILQLNGFICFTMWTTYQQLNVKYID